MSAQSNAKIITEPRFIHEGKTYFMNDVINDTGFNNKISQFLRTMFTDLPISAFKRIPDKNYYLINSGEKKLSTDDLNYFFSKLSEYKKEVSINIAGEKIKTILQFNFFGDFPQGLLNSTGAPISNIFQITDYELANATLRDQLTTEGTDLSTLDIENVYLDGAYLLGANFTGSVLKAVKFRFTHLICANFANLKMPNTSFEDADLRYANFANSKLDDNNFQRANLKHAIFAGSEINNISGHTAGFQNTNCKGAVFDNCDFTFANFQGADLTDAVFKGTKTKLMFANFQGAIITNAKFDGTNWQDATFDIVDTGSEHNTEYEDEYESEPPVQPYVLEGEDAVDDEALPGDRNTCYSAIDLYDKNIKKYLAKDPGNFILKKGETKECESLKNLKLQYFSEEFDEMEGYYECSSELIAKQNEQDFTMISFGPGDFYPEIEYVKVGSYNDFIIKPDWFYEGPVPEPRIFKLVATGDRKRLISKRIATNPGTNVVSDVHCDPLDTFNIYRLEPVRLKRTKRTRKLHFIKPSNKYQHRTVRRSKNSKLPKAGGSRKQLLKKQLLKKIGQKNRTKKTTFKKSRTKKYF